MISHLNSPCHNFNASGSDRNTEVARVGNNEIKLIVMLMLTHVARSCRRVIEVLTGLVFFKQI